MNTSHRILVVEDEPSVRLVFLTALRENNYSISTAPDGETALMWLGQEPFDLVLLDLRMPGMSGMEVLGRLRDQGNDIPVIIISAHDCAPNVVQKMKLGAIDFLVKPLTTDTLRRAVAEVLLKDRNHGKEGGGRLRREKAREPARERQARALRHRLFHLAGVLLREAIKENPGEPEPRYLLGVLHEVTGKSRAASEAYWDALRVAPEYEPAKLHVDEARNGKMNMPRRTENREISAPDRSLVPGLRSC